MALNTCQDTIKSGLIYYEGNVDKCCQIMPLFLKPNGYTDNVTIHWLLFLPHALKGTDILCHS